MSKKFTSPTMLILNESLLPLLKRLDECIEFMSTNVEHYLEANHYLDEYQKFQLSALFTIRTHVINTLKQTAQQVMPENDSVLTSNDSVFTLYYGKFQINAHRIKTLMQQIEHRTKKSETFVQYLDDCHRCYFNIRSSLLIPVLNLATEDIITSSGRNYCSLIRSLSKLYINICRDEYQLYFQFFTQVNNSLTEFTDQLCSNLYNKLRPIVIHLEHLESLSEMCNLIKFEFIEENLHQDELESFVKSMRQLLQDTQERLVYRCNIYVENNILNYSPVSGDLAYPEKLEMMKSISDNLTTDKDNEVMNNEKSKSTMRRSDSVSSIISSVSDISFAQGYQSSQSRIVSSKAVADLHGMWYPTVRSSIMCLSKLYRTLDRTTFQSLSQEVLLACVDSLQVAFDLIKIKKSPLDGFLFIIKYLLIIREQITPFQIDTSIKEVFLDFTPTKTAVFDLIQNRTNLFSLTSNNALLKLIFEGTPQVSEKVIDSQKAVDNKIKEKCEEFIEYSYEYLTKELEKIIFVTQFNSIDNESKDLDDFNLRMSETFKDFLKKKELLQQKMSLYLVNTETEAIIFKQIDSKIQNLFGKLQKILNAKLANFEIVEKKQIPSIKDLID
ncbi:Conserved oligomeric Golgi complex subunit 3 [Sarcoptes scabiei]|nr:Conserved oligomeric Golgi complex subunit 3 [Sarcoptes scabiei]